MRILLLMVIVVLIAAGLSHSAEDKPEFRAVWVSSYGGDCDMATAAGIDKLVEYAQLANLNALVVQVRKTGDAFYKSSYEPRAEELTGKPADFDPLDHLIKKAHAAGIEVHAWLNTYKVWGSRTPPKDPNHVYVKHPEWVNMTKDGVTGKSGSYGLDPGIKEVQEHTYNVFMDLVKKYDVDGVHFDYVRYWDPFFGYSKLALDRYNREKKKTGVPDPFDPDWSQWRRDRVTDLVRQVYEGVKTVKPWVKVTGSVVCSGECTRDFSDTRPYTLLLQQWERWLREGIIDAVVPMNYKGERDAETAVQFRDWIDGMVRWKAGRHVYNGISVSRIEDMVVQINETRKRGADGVVCFSFSGQSSRAEELARGLAKEIFQNKAPTPPMPWKPAKPTPEALAK